MSATRHPPGPYHVVVNADETADLYWDVVAEATFWDADRAYQITGALNKIVRSQYMLDAAITRLTTKKPSRKVRKDILRLLKLARRNLEEGRSAQVLNGRGFIYADL